MRLLCATIFCLLFTTALAVVDIDEWELDICEGCCDKSKDCAKMAERGFCDLLKPPFREHWEPKVASTCRKTCGLCKTDEYF
ncbi:hypothetical protein QR680_013912 [Steinernema hermaphroditum]|uniref:ShKT domain-containing protein n=1 Tax=Steinernema hermaphroditum TaxID=289476 RepID=A0AA39I743_9BILA|nr:hypothetical protein QR680_013912 [Steinernema hermaphroditum]